MRNHGDRIKLERKRQGICSRCAKHPAIRGTFRCQICLDRALAQEKERTRLHRIRGLCTRCGKPVVPGFVKCDKHRAMNRVAVNKRVANVKARGRCRGCGGPTDSGFVTCSTCLAIKAEERRRRL